jgi:hypothetical protein
MEDEEKEVLNMILARRMELKAKLEVFRFLEENNPAKSYQREINEMLDEMNELNELYDRLKR